MTTRKAGALALASLWLLTTAGCSTPGPLHLYAAASGAALIHDASLAASEPGHDCPSYLAPTDTLTGFAYDPFTDHFFLRLTPGNHIRVVDRPARKIKREFDIPDRGLAGGGDLAVCPRDGHMFLVTPPSSVVTETTRFGNPVRRIQLETNGVPAAIAYDARTDGWVVLLAGGTQVQQFGRTGRAGAITTLRERVGDSIAFDADRGELYAPLARRPGEIGVFNGTGDCVRTIAVPAGAAFVDVGPHSFLRVF